MEIPRQIGPYRPLEHLGSGGMGEVYLARAPDGTLLAVKTIRADLITRPDLRVRLRREAEALSRVRGEHLAELVGYDLDTEPPYLATRYVQGRSLRDVVTGDGPLPPAALWRLADGLARALTTVHRAGYLHRDLKPANVMVVDGSPVVIDFGISHALDDTRLSRHGRASGTPAYMAPELVASGRAEPAGDVYSWAATVAYAATGRDAHWSGLGPAELARILFSAETLSPELRDVLDPAFAPDPRDRPAADELVERLAPLAPVTGADLHLDHPHDPAATTVTLTLPGPRRVTLDLPADVEAGTTLRFPGQGRLGRNGGAPGTLHLHLVSLKDFPPAVNALRPMRARGLRSRRALLGVLGFLVFGMIPLSLRAGSIADNEEWNREFNVASPNAGSLMLYSAIPGSCQLLSMKSVHQILPEALAPTERPLEKAGVGEGSSCWVDGKINGFASSLLIEVSLVQASTRERILARCASVFLQGQDAVKKNPYSRSTYREFSSGDAAFSYIRVVNDETRSGAEARVDNVILSATVFQPLDASRDPVKSETVRERLEELVKEIISDLPSRAIVASPGS